MRNRTRRPASPNSVANVTITLLYSALLVLKMWLEVEYTANCNNNCHKNGVLYGNSISPLWSGPRGKTGHTSTTSSSAMT